MATKSDLTARYPGVFYLDAGAVDEMAAYLRRRGWIAGGEHVLGATKAGEGNMNCTLRVTTSARTFILKQARPWVEKYPHIAAPWDRIAVEAGFYELVSSVAALAAMMPRRLWFDAASRLLALEDLGTTHDLPSIYRGDELAPTEIEALAAYLRALHRSFRARRNPLRSVRIHVSGRHCSPPPRYATGERGSWGKTGFPKRAENGPLQKRQESCLSPPRAPGASC